MNENFEEIERSIETYYFIHQIIYPGTSFDQARLMYFNNTIDRRDKFEKAGLTGIDYIVTFRSLVHEVSRYAFRNLSVQVQLPNLEIGQNPEQRKSWLEKLLLSIRF